MRNKLTLAVAFGLALAFTLSCSSENKEDNPSSSSNNSTPSQIVYGDPVSHGGETYETVVIGTQTWFKRNLNYDVPNNKCYYDEPANCAIYGRLYDWETAKNVCPLGWHLPSKDEWDVLMNFADNVTKLVAKSGWPVEKTDDYGFSALPGGHESISFVGVGNGGYWWSATEDSNSAAYGYVFGITARVAAFSGGFTMELGNYFNSVRCIKDN
ncbi:MAG: hypothetical protein LBC64_00015 [Fibromonadaceae bacterium]|nr:hypothetical protein [Fibromonadaceae bacterium]